MEFSLAEPTGVSDPPLSAVRTPVLRADAPGGCTQSIRRTGGFLSGRVDLSHMKISNLIAEVIKPGEP